MRTMKAPLITSAVLVVALASASVAWATGYEQNIEKTFHVTPGGELRMRADRGSVTIKTDQTEQGHVQVFRKVNGGSKAGADELFNNHQVMLTQEGNKVIVLATNKQRLAWKINRPNHDAPYEISIPKKFDVELRTAG